MEFIDTHAHLYAQAFAAEIDQVVARSRDQHVRKIYMPNIDLGTISGMLALEAKYPDLCAAMMGIHPCYIGRDFQKQLAHVETWLAKRPFAAIGEVGIDLYRDKTYQAQQEEALAIQLNWARQYQLPVVIHCRAGMQTTLHLLEKHQDGNLKGIFHCFSGSLQEAERIIALGFYLGIGGIVTFKNAGLDQIVATIGLDYLVLETDSPYLAPTPHRGQRNEPAHLHHIAAKIAVLKTIDLETVAQVTTANVMDVFKGTKL
ncbi:MAG TPA: hydrolase TatD [Amoebophilaceae bacterium]|nr:hydrolase TatD [Amoebophilaceae bacterium]